MVTAALRPMLYSPFEGWLGLIAAQLIRVDLTTEGRLPLSKDEVLHVARLARVGLTAADLEKFQHQLSDILDHFEVLKGIPTDDVPATMHTLLLEGVVSSDEPRPSLPQEEVLRNAPREQDGYLRVRAVLDE
jgi:aspartyl-tRNA(Asn)/glutamyl-tRNA(Gln) amidotransferase subunit C